MQKQAAMALRREEKATEGEYGSDLLRSLLLAGAAGGSEGIPDAPLRAHASRRPMAHSEAVWGLQLLACKSNAGSSDSVISAFITFRLTA